MNDELQRYFPEGSLDPQPNRHRSQAEWFATALQRLGEGPLHPGGSACPLVIRLLCLPTWSPACSVRVEQHGLNWTLAARELDGDEAGFDLGKLSHQEIRRLTNDEARRVACLWKYVRFWSLGPDEGDGVFDGTTYVIEAAESAVYGVVQRCDPEWGDTFGEFSDLLIEIACLAPR